MAVDPRHNEEPPRTSPMVTVHIDKQPFPMREGQNLLQACLSAGLDVPYFCWHPALGSVGACRQCAIKQFRDADDTKGRIVMSCMTPVADGMYISIDDDEVKSFRASVIEWLMTNHPHDCPVCDEGGECHLQDMTVMTGHDYRRYRFTKRTHTNQDLGPCINHEMNRCIQCYRCVRYYRDYAGGRDFGPFASHNHVYFGRHEDGTLESEFSGNLVEVCPTGVFTDKTLKEHYTRPWDLQTAPSVCMHCGLGCNVIPGERYGEIRRIRNRYHSEVNGYFLCDRGRYGYAFVNAPERIREPQLRDASGAVAVATRETLVANWLHNLVEPLRAGKVVGIGSPRASIESNFALRRLVGESRFSCGMPRREKALYDLMIQVTKDGPARLPSLREIGDCDAIFVLGEDVTHVAPVMELRIREAVQKEPLDKTRRLGIPDWNDIAVREVLQEEHGPLFVATMTGSKLDAAATRATSGTPEALSRLGFAVAHAIDSKAPAVSGLSDDDAALAREIATALAEADRPLIVSGPSCGSEDVIQAAAQIGRALVAAQRMASLVFTVPECNSIGAALMDGCALEDAAGMLASGEADTVIIVENDLYRRAPRESVDAMLAHAKYVMVLDHSLSVTSSKAHCLISAATFADGDGTVVNNEGRAQRYIQVFKPQPTVQESWRWLGALRELLDPVAAPYTRIDDVIRSIETALPAFAGIGHTIPPSTARFVGQRLPRMSHRASGRTSMNANVDVAEGKIPDDPDSPFTFSMEGYRGPVPASVTPTFWSPGWNSVQGLTRFQEEVGGPLRGGDPGVRLFAPAPGGAVTYTHDIPSAPEPDAGTTVLPVFDIFTSEELSGRAECLAERAAGAHAWINVDDLVALECRPGDHVEITVGAETFRLPATAREAVPRGAVGVTVGAPGIPVLPLPVTHASIKKAMS